MKVSHQLWFWGCLFLSCVFKINFMGQLVWATGWPGIWSNMILAVLARVSLDKVSIWTGGLGKADGPVQCGWASSDQLKAWVKQKGWVRWSTSRLTRQGCLPYLVHQVKWLMPFRLLLLLHKDVYIIYLYVIIDNNNSVKTIRLKKIQLCKNSISIIFILDVIYMYNIHKIHRYIII